MKSVDEVDLNLIRTLQDDPRASYADLARLTGVSQTTARRRVEALLESQVITPAMIPDLHQLGFTTSGFVALNIDANRLYEIAAHIRDLPEVTSLHMTFGRFDLMLFVAQPSLAALREFVVEKIAPISGVMHSEVLISSNILKVLGNWRVPVESVLSNVEAGPNAVANGNGRIRQGHGRRGRHKPATNIGK